MVRELRKCKNGRRELHRRVGGLVVTITENGIELRAERRRTAKALAVTYDQMAKQGLLNGRYSLTEAEWAKPLDQLWRLAQLPQA